MTKAEAILKKVVDEIENGIGEDLQSLLDDGYHSYTEEEKAYLINISKTNQKES